MDSSSESSSASRVSSDQENGVSDLENRLSLQSRNASVSQSSGDEGEPGVKAVTTMKRKRQSGDDEPTAEGEESSSKVLSRAEKRRQRKREQQQLKSGRSEESGAAADVPIVASSTNRRQNSVWVGNLSYKTTADDLLAFFAEVGDITRINMPTKVAVGPGKRAENRGFAYVDFSTLKAKVCAIALSERPLTGRKLLIKDGDDFTGRSNPAGFDSNVTGDSTDRAAALKTCSKKAQKILRAQNQPPGPTLFLGNLGFETTEADILEMLNAHRVPSAGRHQQQKWDGLTVKDESKPSFNFQSESWIRKVRMGTFEDSGLCKGFAFIDFLSTEDATSALINPKNFFLNGRKLVVEYASPDAVRRGGAPKSLGKVPRLGDKVGRRLKSFPTDDKTPKAVQQQQQQSVHVGDEDEEAKSLERPSKRQRMDDANVRLPRAQNDSRKCPKPRAKPGATLASAQRESVAIMPSQGQKIKFD